MNCDNSQLNLEAYKAYAKARFGLSFSEIFDNLRISDPEFGDLARLNCQTEGATDSILLRIATETGTEKDDTAFSAIGPTADVVGQKAKKVKPLIWGIIGILVVGLVAFYLIKQLRVNIS